MDIGLSISLDSNSEHKTECILDVSNLLESGLKDRNYNVINHYWILCKIVKTIPGLEHITKIPRPRFVEHRRLRNVDNTFTDFYGVYTCGFKIDFEEYDDLSRWEKENNRGESLYAFLIRLATDANSDHESLANGECVLYKSYLYELYNLLSDNYFIKYYNNDIKNHN